MSSTIKYSFEKTIQPKIVFLLCVILISSCANNQSTIAPQAPLVTAAPVKPALSPLPLSDLSEIDYKFAQAALDQLGYDVVFIDGIWGPRSATAIKEFEKDHQLISADGGLSELNLTSLSDMTNVQRDDFINKTQIEPVVQSVPDNRGIATKLDPDIPLSRSPQLIITDLTYAILAKPNPFSETVTQLPQGAGLYVISQQEGWYEVETLERQRGYIQE